MKEGASGLKFAEYFFRAGIDSKCNLLTSRLEDINVSDNEPVSTLDLPSDMVIQMDGKAQNSNEKAPHPLTYRYEADTIYRYPATDSDELKYPPYTPMFCFPKDVSFLSHENGKPPDTFHSFIITDADGAKIYGVCLKTYILPCKEHAAQMDVLISDWRTKNLVESDYEFAQHVQTQLAFEKEKLLKMKLGAVEDSRELSHEAEETINVLEELISPLKQSVLVEPESVRVPTCIGVLSRLPWYDLLKDWLCLVANAIQSSSFERFPFERYAVNLIHEIPLPPPGKLEISIPFGDYKLYFSRPPINTCQIMKNYSFYPLFRTMSIENIVTIFELLVSEYKVVLMSEHVSMLTLICETLCSWMFPLRWHHILIPVLPARLIGYLQAPVPFLVGIQKSSFPQWTEEHWKPHDAAIVDVDNDKIDFPALKIKIPSKERRKLIAHLEKYSGQGHHPIRRGVPESMKYAFPSAKLYLSCAESQIGHRRIKDIPQSMYLLYSNPFLLEKANQSQKITITKNLTANDFPKSFDVLSPQNKSSAARQESFQVSDSHVRASVSSFVHTPRASIPNNYTGSTSNANSELESSTGTGIDQVSGGISLPVPLSSTQNSSLSGSKASTENESLEISVTPSLPKKTSPDKVSWWQKYGSTTSATTATPRIRTPSIFDKLMGNVSSEDVVKMSLPTETAAITSTPTINAEGASTIVSSPLPQSPQAPTFSKEGHVFHELILSEIQSREVDIDQEINVDESEEYADRFTPDSGSSDEFSRSDMSTTTDVRPQIFNHPMRSQRSIGKQRSVAASIKKETLKGKHETSPVMIKEERVRRKRDIPECSYCLGDTNPHEHTILMCQYCHIQIHQNCLTLAEGAPCQVHFNEEKISMGFFRFFTSVMKHYKTYLYKDSADPSHAEDQDQSTDHWFKKHEFLSEFDSDSKPFMAVLIETQAFAQFILDRIERPDTDYEILFFDESIKQKMNRSRMKFSKEATPFLNDTSCQISATIDAVHADLSDLPPDDFHSSDPYDWYSAFEKSPRAIQQLITEGDQMMMRSHTNELVQRSLNNSRSKYDFSKWMKGIWKSGALKDSEISPTTPEAQKRVLLEAQLNQVNHVIDQYQSAHISSQTYAQLETAVTTLLEQNGKLTLASDEDLLVDNILFQRTLVRLMEVISIYQEQLSKLPKPVPKRPDPKTVYPLNYNPSKPPPLPPRPTFTAPIFNHEKVSNWVHGVEPSSPESPTSKSENDDDFKKSTTMSQAASFIVLSGSTEGLHAIHMDDTMMAALSHQISSTSVSNDCSIQEEQVKMSIEESDDQSATPKQRPSIISTPLSDHKDGLESQIRDLNLELDKLEENNRSHGHGM